jgi:hypothetical protein
MLISQKNFDYTCVPLFFNPFSTDVFFIVNKQYAGEDIK